MQDDPARIEDEPESPETEAGLDPAAVVDDPQGAVGGERARLVVKRNGIETSEEFAIGESATIGRFDPSVGPVDVDLGPLPEGAYVSRRHARLTREEGAWRLEDLGSSNGTFVLRDGEFERAESAEINDGDEFALGNARFVLRAD